MRRYVGWSGAVALMVLSAIGLSSCGGGSNSTNADAAPRTPQFVLDPVGTTSNAGSMTMGVSSDGIDANGADRIRVFAQLLDQERRPMAGRTVYFQTDFPDSSFLPEQEPPSPACQPFFPCVQAITDGDGIAVTTLVAPATPGRMAVVAFTSRNLRLSALAFVTVFDVGFIPTDGGVVVIPSEIVVSDPSAGSTLQFIAIGGTPFTDANPPPGNTADFDEIEAVAQETLPYSLVNGESGVGVAEMVFDGRFPVPIVYTIGGRVGGAHTWSVVDAKGAQATGTVTVEFSELTITPESATLEVGQSQTFALGGGVAPYECTPSGGTISPTTINERGGTFTFFPNEILRPGTFTIVCTDQSGQTVSASVSITPLPTPEPSASGGPGPTPSPAPVAARVSLEATPPTLNGPDGGTSTVTATVLDAGFRPLSGIPVIWTIGGQTGDPTPTVPSISPVTGITNGNGQTATTLTVPSGTAPQFIQVTAETDNNKTGTVQVGVTSQTTDPGGDPVSISSAVLRADGCQVNNDGTLTAILSALVIDEDSNPAKTGVEVLWSGATPAGSTVVSPSFTNGEVPCNVSQYRAGCDAGGQLLTISPQPGTATTCFTFAESDAGRPAQVTATIAGTDIETITNFTLPAPEAPPAPTPQPPPAPTPTPGPPTVAPSVANLDVGQTQVFAISGGVPPYTVSPSGGTATPTTVPSSGGTFEYVATTVGSFTVLISDSNGQVTSATVNNAAATAIQVDKPGPLSVPFSTTETIAITGGGVPPYTVTLSGGLGGSISGSPLAGPGSFGYNAPGAPTSGQIVITDSAGTPNTLSISVFVP